MLKIAEERAAEAWNRLVRDRDTAHSTSNPYFDRVHGYDKERADSDRRCVIDYLIETTTPKKDQFHFSIAPTGQGDFIIKREDGPLESPTAEADQGTHQGTERGTGVPADAGKE